MLELVVETSFFFKEGHIHLLISQEDGQLMSTAVDELNGYPRYKYEISPRSLITISATGNRVYIMQVILIVHAHAE